MQLEMQDQCLKGYVCFNACKRAFYYVIVALRELHIISLIDGLKKYITNRIVKLRDFMLRY